MSREDVDSSRIKLPTGMLIRSKYYNIVLSCNIWNITSEIDHSNLYTEIIIKRLGISQEEVWANIIF